MSHHPRTVSDKCLRIMTYFEPGLQTEKPKGQPDYKGLENLSRRVEYFNN